MKNLTFILIFLILTVIAILSAGCRSREISAGVSNSLIKITDEGIADTDSDIFIIDQQLITIEKKLSKLEQVLTPAIKWTDYQKTISRVGSWRIEVTQGDLNKFKNDQYQITALEFINDQGKFSSAIKIRDLITAETYNWNVLQDDLKSSLDNLEQQRKNKIEARNLSALTLNNVLKYFNKWEIREINSTTFTVSGIGLGWAKELTTGMWTYYKANSKLVPRNAEAENLASVLSGH